MTRRMRWTAMAAMLAGAGCSGSSPTTMRAASVRESGFLGDYSHLQPGGQGQALLVYVAPDANIARYDKILLDRVVVWGSETAGDVPPAEMQRLADLLYGQIAVALRTFYVFVDAPGPGVLRVRGALTEAKPADRGLNIWSNITLIGGTVNQASEMTTGTSAFVGAAAAELEIRDAQTNTVLLQAVDSRVGTHTLTDASDKWEAVDASFRIWAQRLVTRLQSLGGPQRVLPWWAQPQQ